jgi:pimeloyl-ACP methyl ester carboxylesterase
VSSFNSLRAKRTTASRSACWSSVQLKSTGSVTYRPVSARIDSHRDGEQRPAGPAGAPTETPFFFGAGPDKAFAVTYVPQHVSVGGLVICGPINNETQKSHRRETLLARALVERGVAVLRFNYRGQGHSDGESEMLTFESMREDALAAAAELQSQLGGRPLAVGGVRLGAIVAGSMASEVGSESLALWAPADDPKSYFREAFRVRRMKALSTGRPVGPERPEEELERVGFVDVIGCPIHLSLVDSFAGKTLGSVVGDGVKRALVAPFAAGLTPALAALAEEWTQKGMAVTSMPVDEQESWWFFDGMWCETPAFRTLLTGTVDWIVEQLEQA